MGSRWFSRTIKLNTMKTILYLILLSVAISTSAQEKYLTKTGTLYFEASVPSFEEVAANNKGVTAILNAESGEFASLALVKGFRFKNALMEEHFNENYAESHLYPKATFKGTIINFDANGTNSKYDIKGELTFHGVTKSIEVNGATIIKKGNNYSLSGNFSASPADYNIEIPKIVRSKIAESIDITFEFNLEPK